CDLRGSGGGSIGLRRTGGFLGQHDRGLGSSRFRPGRQSGRGGYGRSGLPIEQGAQQESRDDDRGDESDLHGLSIIPPPGGALPWMALRNSRTGRRISLDGGPSSWGPPSAPPGLA